MINAFVGFSFTLRKCVIQKCKKSHTTGYIWQSTWPFVGRLVDDKNAQQDEV
jgi:hypothetical protein